MSGQAANGARVAVVTGANRGLGLETGRELAALGWSVVLTGRDEEAVTAAASEVAASTGATVEPYALDVTEEGSSQLAAVFVRERFGRLDALVNNAGAIFGGGSGGNPLVVERARVLAAFETNTLGALWVTQAFAPLLVGSGGGNIVNVSSGMGGITEMGGGSTPYRLSKAALNALTRILHAELHGKGVRVNSVCPGWVRTDMGGPGAGRTLKEGARGIVWAATLGPDGPSGGFFRDGKRIAF
jgi:NAD(P)-dependent dehydrogenase (short-subunit alcohol dehydrogenase family)